MLLSGEEKFLDLAPHLRNLVTPLRPKVLNSVDKRSLKMVTKDTTVSHIVEVYFENDLEGKIDFQKRLFKAALGVFNNVPTDMDLFMDMKEDLIFWMGINILHHYLSIEKESRKVYMIHKNFYKTFTKLGIDYSFAHLPMNQTGFVVMPTPLEYPSPIEGKVHFDSFTYSICHENSFCFKNILQKFKDKYGYETSDGVLAISFINENLSMVSIVVPLPKDSNLKIKDLFIQHLPKGQDQFLKVASLLCYINTGNPDLSDFRNPIRYQSPTNKTPIKEDRHLSPANIVRIGFGWKKDRDWHIDQWDIKASEAVKWMRKEVAEKEGVFDPNAPTLTNHKGTILYGIKRPRKETTGHRRMKKENK